MKRVLALAAVGALVLSACSDDTTTTPPAATPSTSAPPAAQAFTVKVDNKAPEIASFFLAMFPKQTSAHPGDTINFSIVYTGEPHTVALGTNPAKVADFHAKNPKAEPPKELEGIVPELLPEGPGDAFQAGAQPCLLAAGGTKVADQTKPCAEKPSGTFNGDEALYTSGWLGPDQTFAVKLAETIKPGTYPFFCQLHGTDMGGTIEVVAASTPVKSPAEHDAVAAAELAAAVAKAAPAYAQVQAATDAKPVAGTLAGEDVPVGTSVFAPADIKTKVGRKVTWSVNGPHTISFNAPADAQEIRVAAPDGSVHINPKAVTPAGGPGQGNPDKPAPINGGRYDGSGFRSSGIIIAFGPPGAWTYSLTFTKAGTFEYICGVHPDMKGTVTVA